MKWLRPPKNVAYVKALNLDRDSGKMSCLAMGSTFAFALSG